MEKKRVALLTRDRYLYQKIFLDLSRLADVEICSDVQGADTVICDIDSCEAPTRECIRISKSAPCELPYPFALGAVSRLLERAGESPALTYDEGERCVYLRGRKTALTDIEFALFLSLARRRGEWASRAELLREVWGREEEATLLNVYVHYLREKLEREGERVICSSRKSGYRIDEKYFEEGE